MNTRTIITGPRSALAASAILMALVAGPLAPSLGQATGKRPAAPGGRTLSNSATQQTGPAPVAGDFEASMSAARRLEVRDRSRGRAVVSPSDTSPITGTTLATVIEMTPVVGGFDLKVTYTNPGQRAEPLGSILVPGVLFGQVVNHFDFRHEARRFTFDRGERFLATGGLKYPGDLYSPVMVFSNAEYTLGLSLLYPVVEYDHAISTHLWSTANGRPQAERPWTAEFRLEGSLAPGATRSYTVAARMARASEPWVTTLTPYRDYFRSVYGNVRYTRDPRPVMAVFASYQELTSQQNPRGFVPAIDRPRIDQSGWGPWADWMVNEAQADGIERVMVWCPSGTFRTNKELNFPFQFLTPLRGIPAANESLNQLRLLPSRGLQMGYWWGRSQQVMRGWDNGQQELFNPDNPEHVQLAFAELDMAASLGATTVGLDAYVYLGPRASFRWLEQMRRRAPNIKFVTELSAPDILHVLGPTYFYSDLLNDRPMLADLVLPGHETWAQVKPSSNTLIATHREIQRVAALGFVPIISGAPSMPSGSSAIESWRYLPAAAREPAGSQPSNAFTTLTDVPAPSQRSTATPATRRGRR